MALAGILLILGFLTPVMSGVVGMVTVALKFSLLSPPDLNLFDSPVPAFLSAAMASALILLGPGGTSVDARLFGRREIIIPQRSKS